MGIAAFSTAAALPDTVFAIGEIKRRSATRLKLGLNAYSFSRPLRAGEMTIDDVVDFCAEHEIDGVDMTGYYFPGYPEAPGDEIIYNLKKKSLPERRHYRRYRRSKRLCSG